MSGVRAVALAAALAAWLAPAAAPANEAEAFMRRYSGEWVGTGQLLIGPSSGLQFHCALKGDPSTELSFGMQGKCWMGALSAPVHARIRYNAETKRFYGSFMDGAEGDGADIVGRRNGEGLAMRLTRGPARGSLEAAPIGDKQMKVVLSLYDRKNDRHVPVVAMGFTRKEAAEMGLPKLDLSKFAPPPPGLLADAN